MASVGMKTFTDHHKAKPFCPAPPPPASRRWEVDLWWKECGIDTIAGRDYFGYKRQKNKSNWLKQNEEGEKKRVDSFNGKGWVQGSNPGI